SSIDQALAGAGVAPDLVLGGKSADGNVLFVHRAVADGDVWFLNNRKASPETLEARFRVTGKQPELWHADTGEVEAVSYRIENGQTIVPLTLDAEDSVFVVFRKAARADAMAIKKVAPATASALGGTWTVAFQPGRGAPASIALPKLGSLSEQADPAVKYFSGLATYTSTFNLPKSVKPGQPLWVNLGEVGEIAEVSVNGKHAGYAWHKPYRVDVAGAVKKGVNTIEVKVANLWVNRLIGDAQDGATKVTWTAIPTYTAAAPLRPSGLIGPVTLEVSGSAAPSNP
ncbi:MAG: glycosylhydrolase-like jelly roll fold domain-containing protein, partial [Pseudomonadota bacterium]